MAAAAFTPGDLVYDPDRHRSWLPDGREVPHVTHVLKCTGLVRDFGALADRSPRAAANLEYARAQGSAVHADCHAYDDDDLDLAQVDPQNAPYVDAWIQARRDLQIVPVAHARERLVYHATFHYCGIQDGVFRRGLLQPQLILADIKRGDPDDAAAHLQTAAYEAAWTRAHPDMKIDERWAVWLRPGRRVPYTIVNYTRRPGAAHDFSKFLAALTVYNEQPARRPRIA